MSDLRDAVMTVIFAIGVLALLRMAQALEVLAGIK